MAKEQEDGVYGVIVPYTDQSESFKHGVEFGIVLERMESGTQVIEGIWYTANHSNFTRAAAHFGYKMDTRPCRHEFLTDYHFEYVGKAVMNNPNNLRVINGGKKVEDEPEKENRPELKSDALVDIRSIGTFYQDDVCECFVCEKPTPNTSFVVFNVNSELMATGISTTFFGSRGVKVRPSIMRGHELLIGACDRHTGNLHNLKMLVEKDDKLSLKRVAKAKKNA